MDKGKIKEDVEHIIEEDLVSLERKSGELEIGDRQYLVMPLDEIERLGGLVSKAIELTLDRCSFNENCENSKEGAKK